MTYRTSFLLCGKPTCKAGHLRCQLLRLYVPITQNGRRRGAESESEGDDEDSDLFRLRNADEAGSDSAAPDLDADDALDASALPLAELDVSRWAEDGAAEQLRNRFVTGESSLHLALWSCFRCTLLGCFQAFFCFGFLLVLSFIDAQCGLFKCQLHPLLCSVLLPMFSRYLERGSGN